MTPNQKAQLRSLVASDTWSVLVQFAEECKEKWSKTRPSQESEFLFIKESVERDAKGDGVQSFMKQIEDLFNTRK